MKRTEALSLGSFRYLRFKIIGRRLSRPYLSALFKKENGITLSDYIASEKVKEACHMLEYTDKSILEISTALGFSSQSHFTKVFKKIKGVTPKSIRNEPR